MTYLQAQSKFEQLSNTNNAVEQQFFNKVENFLDSDKRCCTIHLNSVINKAFVESYVKAYNVCHEGEYVLTAKAVDATTYKVYCKCLY